MRKPDQVIFSNMCMIYDDAGRVVVQNRAKPIWPGVAFPGGHVEQGEGFVQSVIREIREETGLEISQPRLCGVKHWISEDSGFHEVVFLYKTNRFTGELISSAEGEVRWVSLNELTQLPLARSMEKTLRLFLEEELSEYYIHFDNDQRKDDFA